MIAKQNRRAGWGALPVSGLVCVVAALAGLALLSGCAHQPSPAGSPPGFFGGLFHGATAPIVLVLGWLWHGRIYAFPNSGWFYDLGFLLGLSIWGGGGAAAAYRQR